MVSSSKTEEICFLVNPVFPAISSRIADLVIAVLAAGMFLAGACFFVDVFFIAFFADLVAAIKTSFEMGFDEFNCYCGCRDSSNTAIYRHGVGDNGFVARKPQWTHKDSSGG